MSIAESPKHSRKTGPILELQKRSSILIRLFGLFREFGQWLFLRFGGVEQTEHTGGL